MNRVVFALMGIILVCCIFSSPVLPQGAADNRDSLRLEIRKLLDNVGQIYDPKSASSIDSARSCLDSALSIAEKNFGLNDTITAITYTELSRFRFANLEYDLSIKLALMALDVLRETPGRNHILALHSYDYMVESCLQLHNLVLCEKYCQKRFEILDNLGEPLTTLEAEQMVEGLNDRARLLELQNRHDEAINDLEEGLGLITDEMSGGAQKRAYLSANIAWILIGQGKMAEAKERLLEVLELAKEAYPPKHQFVLTMIDLLGHATFYLGDYDQADSLIDIAIAMSEELYGNSRPPGSDIWQNQARVRLAQGRTEEAVESALRAVAVNRDERGDYPTHMLMGSLETAGNVAMAAGKWELANDMFDDLLAAKHSFMNTVFGGSSESQKLEYIAKYPLIIHSLLSGTVMAPANSVDKTAMKMVLCGKGMAIDAVAAEHAAAICSVDPYLDSLIEKRRSICNEIADLFSSTLGNEEYASRRLSELYDSKDEIETELSLSCSKMQLDYISDSLTTETVAAKLPERSVLLEFIKYARLDIAKLYEEHIPKGFSYLSMVITPDTGITIVDLGDASVIDSLIEEFHTVMSDALQTHFKGQDSQAIERYLEVSAELYQHIVEPLMSSLHGTNTVYLAADGLLNLIPFETFTKDGDRFLIEDFQFIYVTSGRDLIKKKVKGSSQNAIVMANPDYMTDPLSLPVLAMEESETMFASRGSAETPECLSSMFSPLPMTRQEGMSVADLLSQTGRFDITYLESSRAREGALKNLNQAPDVLHIATHGYFCEQAENPYLSNPLLRSGLILAGANRTIGEMNEGMAGSEDGILTAMEVSGLNLIGTDLVVLSACHTGVGEVQSGEGVFGLRRAFHHAGAKSVIMSMFAVPDESTSELMERFYENWLSGQSKSSALRNASLSILNERRRASKPAHPLFWGGFILVGDPD